MAYFRCMHCSPSANLFGGFPSGILYLHMRFQGHQPNARSHDKAGGKRGGSGERECFQDKGNRYPQVLRKTMLKHDIVSCNPADGKRTRCRADSSRRLTAFPEGTHVRNHSRMESITPGSRRSTSSTLFSSGAQRSTLSITITFQSVSSEER